MKRTFARRTAAGFTLVELMIVVAIIGVLASIALPTYQESQLRSKRAEATMNLRAIMDVEEAYDAAYDEYVEAASNPGVELNKEQHPFDVTMEGWNRLGFEPDGWVRCNYEVACYDGCSWVRADAYCDIDDDNQIAIIRHYGARTGYDEYFEDLYPNRF